MSSLATLPPPPATRPPTVNLGLQHVSRCLPLLSTPQQAQELGLPPMALPVEVEALALGPYIKVPTHMRIVDLKRYLVHKLRRATHAAAVAATRPPLASTLARQLLTEDGEPEAPLCIPAPDVSSDARRKGCELPDVKSVEMFLLSRGVLTECNKDTETLGHICTHVWDRQAPLTIYFLTRWTHVSKYGDDWSYDLEVLTAPIKDATPYSIPWVKTWVRTRPIKVEKKVVLPAGAAAAAAVTAAVTAAAAAAKAAASAAAAKTATLPPAAASAAAAAAAAAAAGAAAEAVISAATAKTSAAPAAVAAAKPAEGPDAKKTKV